MAFLCVVIDALKSLEAINKYINHSYDTHSTKTLVKLAIKLIFFLMDNDIVFIQHRNMAVGCSHTQILVSWYWRDFQMTEYCNEKKCYTRFYWPVSNKNWTLVLLILLEVLQSFYYRNHLGTLQEFHFDGIWSVWTGKTSIGHLKLKHRFAELSKVKQQ